MSISVLTQKLLAINELKKFHQDLIEDDFSGLLYATFLHQKENWGMLSEGWKGFHSSKYKHYDFDWPATKGVVSHKWFGIKAQFNPTRFISSSAKVDTETIQNRKCFLCLNNLPEEQRGVLFEDQLIVLCNPAPIFNEHFTISHIEHKPQSILTNINLMMRLTKATGGDYSIFYNGPNCGASAPDHFHFQACPANELPAENDIIHHPEKFRILFSDEQFSVSVSENYLRNIIIIKSKTIDSTVKVFNSIYQLLQEINRISSEPMMNLLTFLNEEEFYLVIFPREKHRPDVYFAEGEERMLVSPGLVDMAGILVTPLQKDFDKMNNELIEKIYGEASLEQKKFNTLIDMISK
ncbi:MAG: DUF4922 domain-containing protein [Bacteroidetes bacterium]|nr:DUF4922 domain-containing protein [Bacteroidota bacterium]